MQPWMKRPHWSGRRTRFQGFNFIKLWIKDGITDLLNDAKLMKTSAVGWALHDASMLQRWKRKIWDTREVRFNYQFNHWTMETCVEWTGIAISSWPKNSFWNPSEPGLMIPATEGVSLPGKTSFDELRVPKIESLKHTHHRGSQSQAFFV